jgi:predicted ATPase
MVSTIKFKNFKLFKNWQTLEIKPITILIGKNNSGKSAILKLMPLLESSLSGRFDEAINIKEFGVSLGDFPNELIYGNPVHRGELEFEIIEKKKENQLDVNRLLKNTLYIKDGEFKIKNWQFDNLKLDEEENYYIDESENKWFSEFRGFGLNLLIDIEGEKSGDVPFKQFTNKDLTTDYISGFRKKADPYYPYDEKKYEKSGLEGENLYQFLIDDTQTTLKKYFQLTSDWVKTHFEGWEIKVDYDGHRKDLPARISLENEKLKVNLSQTGTGIAQSLPLVIRAYKPCKKETLIIVEEPESHLHPNAHAELAQLFFESIQLDKNKKYLFETHSQNFVLRMRRLVAERELKPEDLAIYYVDYDEDEKMSELVKIDVDSLGKVSFWPEGIFSETLEETIGIRTAQIDRQ